MRAAIDFVSLTLLVRMAVTAAFVVAASVITERAGPLIGGLVSTIPIAAGPTYVFLAMDHDTAFIAAATIGSLAVNAGNVVFALAYVLLAQRAPVWISVPAALAVWFAVAFGVRSYEWTLVGVVIANIVAFVVCVPAADPFLHVRMPPVRRRWYDVPLRATLVACLVGGVVTASEHLGPKITGLLTLFPIVLSSLMAILQPRVGGPAAAAVIAHTLWGLIGTTSAILTLHLAVVPLGAPAALILALIVALVWAGSVWLVRRPKPSK